MHTLAFAGPVHVTADQRAHVRAVVGGLRPYERYVSGGAYGVDTQAAFTAIKFNPTAHHTLVLPKGEWYNTAIESYFREKGLEIIYVPGGYMARNDKLVELADVLAAFPKTPVEALRSGTWATVRRARKAGVPFTIYPLSGLG